MQRTGDGFINRPTYKSNSDGVGRCDLQAFNVEFTFTTKLMSSRASQVHIGRVLKPELTVNEMGEVTLGRG